MKIINTPFEGLLVIEPKVHLDARGYFFEAFNKRLFHEMGIDFDCVQENQSHSKKNTVRGLHFQKRPRAQAKLVRVVKGRILDAVVDLRTSQPTFGKVFTIELSSEEKKFLLVPKGFAHGFSVLSEEAEVVYSCDEYYYPECDAGILHSDSALGIDWKVKDADRIVSAKDLSLPVLSAAVFSF